MGFFPATGASQPLKDRCKNGLESGGRSVFPIGSNFAPQMFMARRHLAETHQTSACSRHSPQPKRWLRQHAPTTSRSRSLNANGEKRRPPCPPGFAITTCDSKSSASFLPRRNLKFSGETFTIALHCLLQTEVVTPYNFAKSALERHARATKERSLLVDKRGRNNRFVVRLGHYSPEMLVGLRFQMEYQTGSNILLRGLGYRQR